VDLKKNGAHVFSSSGNVCKIKIDSDFFFVKQKTSFRLIEFEKKIQARLQRAGYMTEEFFVQPFSYNNGSIVVLSKEIIGETINYDDIDYYDLGKNLFKIHSVLNDLSVSLKNEIRMKTKKISYYVAKLSNLNNDLAKFIENKLHINLIDLLKLSTPNCISHGDFHKDNLIFVDNKIIGILDLESLRYTNIFFDMCYLLLDSAVIDDDENIFIKRLFKIIKGYNIDLNKHYEEIYLTCCCIEIESFVYALAVSNKIAVNRIISQIEWLGGLKKYLI